MIRAVALERGYVLEEVGVTHAVIGVDAEADARHMAVRDAQLADDREAGHIFHGRPQARFVAEHQDVRASVDEDDRVEVEQLHQRLVRDQQLANTEARECVHGRRQLFGLEETSECALREVLVRP